jgi:hypothetical protein
MDFTYNEYDGLMQYFLNNGYKPVLIGKEKKDSHKRTIFFRHDVDIDYLGVLPIANIEQQLGVFSTWYFLPNCSVYNLLCHELESIIIKLYSMGHQIGLHIDASQYESVENLKTDIEKIYTFFSTRLPLSKTLSFHRPASWLLNDIVINGWVNAYEKTYYSDVVYVSDSNRREFMDENRLSKAVSEGKSLTLLTHPLWWHEQSEDSDETFSKACRYLGCDRIHNYIAKTSKRYTEKGVKGIIR